MARQSWLVPNGVNKKDELHHKSRNKILHQGPTKDCY